MGCCNEPTTKDAYRLSWASLIITILAAWGGFALAVVSVDTQRLIWNGNGGEPFLQYSH